MPNRRDIKACLLSLLFCLLIFLYPQKNLLAGTIQGHVKEQATSLPIIGATIRLKETKFGTVSNQNGDFTIRNIPIGKYKITATAIGYEKQKIKDVIIVTDTSVVMVAFELQEEAIEGTEIVVQARADKETDISARLTEKNADNVMNVITAQSIERSPDNNSADVLKRLSGLSVVADQGEGRYVVMRGLEQRYNNTLVNGIKIPSPEAKDRFLPLDIFPSELLQRIEVTKSLTPDMEGDAIGGTANLIMRDAPDSLFFKAEAAIGYSEFFLNNKFITFDKSNIPTEDPASNYGQFYQASIKDFPLTSLHFTPVQANPNVLYSLTYGNRFFGSKFGLLVSASLQNTYSRTEDTLYTTLVPQSNNQFKPRYDAEEFRSYSTERLRSGITTKLDYVIDPKNIIEANLVGVYFGEDEVRHINAQTISGSSGGSNFNSQDRSHSFNQNVYSLQLTGSHNPLPAIKVNWVADYSDAKNNRPYEVTLSTRSNANPDLFPNTPKSLDPITVVWRRNDDQQYLAKTDVSYTPNPNAFFEIKAGGLIRRLTRYNFENDYELDQLPDSTGHLSSFTSLDNTHLYVPPKSVFGTGLNSAQTYNASETVAAGYVLNKFKVGQLQVLYGVRYEYTQDAFTTNVTDANDIKAVTITYMDFLPSIHFNYLLTSEQNLRFSVTKTLSRPSYYDLVPALSVGEIYNEIGNPNLKPVRSTNFDLRYEAYPNLIEQVTIGAFYKSLMDPIETVLDASNPSNVYLQKQNLGNAYIYGFELSALKKVWLFTLTANYTFANSSISTAKSVPQLDATGAPTTAIIIYPKRQLSEQPKNLINIGLNYENEKSGTFAALSYAFTDRRLVFIDYYDGYDQYQKSTSSLDFSGEQKVFKKFLLYFKVTNLLNTKYEIEIPSGQVIQHTPLLLLSEQYKRAAILGLRYKF
jgi:TonB-dependent receptor